MLKNYTERTITDEVRYKSEFRRIARKIAPESYSLAQWPADWRENPFLKKRNVSKLLLPSGFKLTAGKAACNDGQPLSTRTYIGIEGNSCRLCMVIGEDWTLLSEEKRNHFAAFFKSNRLECTTFLALPIEFFLEVRPSLKKGTDASIEYLWFQKLVDNMRRRMGWGQYLEARRQEALMTIAKISEPLLKAFSASAPPPGREDKGQYA
jgi:hypothetical protein